ncbi:MAG: hypothetical protein EZS28_033225 [Streblomastix strix]|uniref:Calcineurin-like phosphoesterase domain-containing protein n=1 Tax=Streblomastix strix TaxID=222440 RepID=A0A5J4ULH1_9EUKA|nr:MAG: hypothetical protein EZS28_033225 [Streblomastix strix]
MEEFHLLRKTNCDIATNILWSDPVDDINGFQQSERGSGNLFGSDMTKNFCAENKLDLIIRSHQMKMEGFSWQGGQSEAIDNNDLLPSYRLCQQMRTEEQYKQDLEDEEKDKQIMEQWEQEDRMIVCEDLNDSEQQLDKGDKDNQQLDVLKNGSGSLLTRKDSNIRIKFEEEIISPELQSKPDPITKLINKTNSDQIIVTPDSTQSSSTTISEVNTQLSEDDNEIQVAPPSHILRQMSQQKFKPQFDSSREKQNQRKQILDEMRVRQQGREERAAKDQEIDEEVQRLQWIESQGRCLTVFSAPNYCGISGNKGAWCQLRFPREEEEWKREYSEYIKQQLKKRKQIEEKINHQKLKAIQSEKTDSSGNSNKNANFDEKPAQKDKEKPKDDKISGNDTADSNNTNYDIDLFDYQPVSVELFIFDSVS